MKIKIDASSCKNVLAGTEKFNNGMLDYWYYQSLSFESGKVYGLISEYQQGCMYVSYLLGGNIEFEDGLAVFIDDKKIEEKDLKKISWNLEPLYESYKNKKVEKSINQALKYGYITENYEKIKNEFYLTENRHNAKLRNLSGERWRASAALGYALGKKIFFAPYEPSIYYRNMKESNLFKVFDYLISNDCLIVLPVGSDEYLKEYVDECVYIKQNKS